MNSHCFPHIGFYLRKCIKDTHRTCPYGLWVNLETEKGPRNERTWALITALIQDNQHRPGCQEGSEEGYPWGQGPGQAADTDGFHFHPSPLPGLPWVLLLSWLHALYWHHDSWTDLTSLCHSNYRRYWKTSDRYTLFHIKEINNKDPLYSTGNYIQYLVINHNGKESENIYVCIYRERER